mgnify:CR=1 FL=1
MVIDMKEVLRNNLDKGKGSTLIIMETFLKDNGKTIIKYLDCTCIRKEKSIKESFKIIFQSKNYK